MKTVLTAIVLAASTCCASAASWRGEVVGVTDGDTITVRRSDTGEQVKIRILEIDAPERGQAYGKAAKQALSDAAYRRDAVIDERGTDRYGRTLAAVRIGSIDLGSYMLRQGLAWCFVRYAHSPSCETDEAAARAGRRGLWRDDTPVPPWAYRRQHAD